MHWCIVLGQPVEGPREVGTYDYINGEYLTGTTQNPDADGAWAQTPFEAWRAILSAKTGTIDLRAGSDGEELPDEYYTYKVTVS